MAIVDAIVEITSVIAVSGTIVVIGNLAVPLVRIYRGEERERKNINKTTKIKTDKNQMHTKIKTNPTKNPK